MLLGAACNNTGLSQNKTQQHSTRVCLYFTFLPALLRKTNMTRFKAGQQKDLLQSWGHPTCHKLFAKPVTLTWNGHSPCGWACIQAWLCPFLEESDTSVQWGASSPPQKLVSNITRNSGESGILHGKPNRQWLENSVTTALMCCCSHL